MGAGRVSGLLGQGKSVNKSVMAIAAIRKRILGQKSLRMSHDVSNSSNAEAADEIDGFDGG